MHPLEVVATAAEVLVKLHLSIRHRAVKLKMKIVENWLHLLALFEALV